nr:helix-turn-helix domain-containing protein [Kineococcus vitellinus]
MTVRLAALDPEAGAALRVVSYFDELAAAHAGVHAIVRGAAVLTGHPAGLVDTRRHLRVRVDAEGTTRPDTTAHPAPSTGADADADADAEAKAKAGRGAAEAPGPAAACAPTPADPAWLSAPVDQGATLWLERTGTARVVDAVVLERAAALARAVLERTRPLPRGTGAAGEQDGALLDVLTDPAAPLDARRRAARALGLDPAGPVRAIALADGRVHVLPAHQAEEHPEHPVHPVSFTQRAGIGPAVPAVEAPTSLAAARRALRLSAEGTPTDPGARTVHAEHVQALLLLAETVSAGTPPIADVAALDRAAAAAPWMLTTLHALVSTSTGRAAATQLAIHHSTLQERLASAERLLGWNLHTPAGQHRLHLAMALRRLHRNST